ncbi:MAG: hypothetical protein EB023_06880 [Flavobacteriia bacterium]|nr:hypothetical protein [Flavobacteriia bacterium]
MDKKAYMFPTEDALLYIQSDPLGLEGTGFQGHNLWSATNPSFGATFQLYLKNVSTKLKDVRVEKEKSLEKEKKEVLYPSMAELRKEQLEQAPILVWRISNAMGKEVKRFTTVPAKGISRVTWNLRANSTTNAKGGSNGFLVPEGDYRLEVLLVKNDSIDTLIYNHAFKIKALNNQTLVAKDPVALDIFRKKLAEINRKVQGTEELLGEFESQVTLLESVVLNYPETNLQWVSALRGLKLSLDSAKVLMYGDQLLSKHEFESAPSLTGRLGMVEYMLYDNTTGYTKSQEQHVQWVEEEYLEIQKRVKGMLLTLELIEEELSKSSIPYTNFVNHALNPKNDEQINFYLPK